MMAVVNNDVEMVQELAEGKNPYRMLDVVIVAAVNKLSEVIDILLQQNDEGMDWVMDTISVDAGLDNSTQIDAQYTVADAVKSRHVNLVNRLAFSSSSLEIGYGLTAAAESGSFDIFDAQGYVNALKAA